MECVVETHQGNLGTKCTPRWRGYSGIIGHSQRQHTIRGRAFGERGDGVVGPTLEEARQLAIRVRRLGVHSDLDVLVENLEELERNGRDLETAESIPCNKCVIDLFCFVKRREELRLEQQVRRNAARKS